MLVIGGIVAATVGAAGIFTHQMSKLHERECMKIKETYEIAQAKNAHDEKIEMLKIVYELVSAKGKMINDAQCGDYKGLPGKT